MARKGKKSVWAYTQYTLTHTHTRGPKGQRRRWTDGHPIVVVLPTRALRCVEKLRWGKSPGQTKTFAP